MSAPFPSQALKRTVSDFITTEKELTDLHALLRRGLNTWEDAPVWLMGLSDAIEAGCVTAASNAEFVTVPRALLKTTVDIVQLLSRPALTDSMGLPTSCGKPLCAPDEHHPLCSLHKPAAQGTQQATPEPVFVIEVRECPDCGHIGINEWHPTDSACSHCEWTGPSPQEDKCPGCGTVGSMSSACPECGHKDTLIASKHLPMPAATPEPVEEHKDGWLQEGGLLYRLTDGRRPENRDEINVTMADGSRTPEARARRAGELLDRIRDTRPAPGVPQGWKLSVSDSDGRKWLHIESPGGAKAALSTEATTDGGRRATIAAQVLDAFSEAQGRRP